MPDIEQFTTIKGFCEFTLKEKGSEFIAQAFPVETEEDIHKILNDIKKVHYDASHHCYAAKLPGSLVKYSDDGEPSGTAGIKILNAIDHFSLSSVIVIVIRYFGGIKLGVGPLGKAYYTASEMALKKCEQAIKKAYIEITVKSEFIFVSQVHHVLALYKAKILKTDYLENVNYYCLIQPVYLEKLIKHLAEVSRGSIVVENQGKTLFLSTIV